MSEQIRNFKHSEINQRAISHITSFLLENYARPIDLLSLPSVGMETKKGPFHWVEAAYFLGKTDVSRFKHGHNGKKVWARFSTKDGDGNKINHYFSVGSELPELTLSEDPMTDQVISIDKRAETDRPENGGSMAVIHVPTEVRNGIKSGQKVVIENAIFVDVPLSVQEELGIELGYTAVLIATKVKDLV